MGDAVTADTLAGRLRDLANGPVDEHLAELLFEIADGVSALSALKPGAPSADERRKRLRVLRSNDYETHRQDNCMSARWAADEIECLDAALSALKSDDSSHALLKRLDSYFSLLEEEMYLNPSGRKLWAEITALLADERKDRHGT